MVPGSLGLIPRSLGLVPGSLGLVPRFGTRYHKWLGWLVVVGELKVFKICKCLLKEEKKMTK